jgi:tRNA(Ile)-lysidine synthetase-like protein
MSEKFGLVEWWFSGNQSQKYARWFQSNPVFRSNLDEFVKKEYSDILKKYEEIHLDDIHSVQDLLEGVIALDQVSRHVYRNCGEAVIKCNTRKATEMSHKILCAINMPEKHFTDFLTEEELSFVFMPYKHSSVEKFGNMLLACLIHYESHKYKQLSRFRKDLLKKYSPLLTKQACENPVTVSVEKSTNINFADVCEYLPEEFYSLSVVSTKPHRKLSEAIKNTICNFKGKIVVSLSGGVDSMVLCHYLSTLKNSGGVVAVHINYKNRPESNKEANFVAWYCNRLKIPLYTRNVTELHRKNGCDREFYESHTRSIRFDMYRQIAGDQGVVVLGHTHDDLVENIWTNFARGRDLFNLKKMQKVDTQDGVTLVRPLLDLDKDCILEYSKRNGIAYLLNTTPEWSNRGKFRNTFLGAINTQFTSQAHKNVEFLADSLCEYQNFLQRKLFQPFLDNVKLIKRDDVHYGFKIPICTEHIQLGLHFWQIVLSDVLHPCGIRLPSRKSIQKLITAIQTDSFGMQTLSGELYVQYEIAKDAESVQTNSLWILKKREIIDNGIVDCDILKLGAKHWKQIKEIFFI